MATSLRSTGLHSEFLISLGYKATPCFKNNSGVGEVAVIDYILSPSTEKQEDHEFKVSFSCVLSSRPPGLWETVWKKEKRKEAVGGGFGGVVSYLSPTRCQEYFLRRAAPNQSDQIRPAEGFVNNSLHSSVCCN